MDYAIVQAQRFIDAGAFLIMMESEGDAGDAKWNSACGCNSDIGTGGRPGFKPA